MTTAIRTAGVVVSTLCARGLAGDDALKGGEEGGRDTLYGGPGDDHLYLTDQTRQNVTVRGCETVTTTPIN
ncbi:MAG: hypothetical protein JWP74_3989 [Marmoricola sp.]|nr:hypothetical protein [Marmoricola sp.]